MSIPTTTSPYTTAAMALDTADGTGCFAAGNLAGIGDLMEVTVTAISAARSTAPHLADAALISDPVAVGAAAAAIAARDGLTHPTAHEIDTYLLDARTILTALS